MCPLIGKVLAEPEPLRSNTNGNEQFVGEGDVIGDIFVCDDAGINCFTHGHFDRQFAFLLVYIGEKRHFVCRVAGELRVTVFFVWVNKDLCFSLRELPEPDHALPW